LVWIDECPSRNLICSRSPPSFGDICDTDRGAKECRFDDEIDEVYCVVGLGSNEAKNELMIGFIESG
jgi:hypothetical protein